jgi:hypothetical protein
MGRSAVRSIAWLDEVDSSHACPPTFFSAISEDNLVRGKLFDPLPSRRTGGDAFARRLQSVHDIIPFDMPSAPSSGFAAAVPPRLLVIGCKGHLNDVAIETRL